MLKGDADASTTGDGVRVNLWGPRGGFRGCIELDPGRARALSRQLMRAADETEGGTHERVASIPRETGREA